MLDKFNSEPHRRYNILTDEWVLVSPHRTKRPWQGKTDKIPNQKRPSYDEKCYLCPTNTRAGGEINPEYSGTYSFVNDFAAVFPGSNTSEYKNGLLQASGETGICKVVCFSPDHSLTLPLMEVNEIHEVIKLWQREYEELGGLTEINHVQIFENKGDIMGCSNPHPHGQIWSQSSIPETVLKKQKQQRTHWDHHKRSLLKDYIEQEIELSERIVLENEHFVALVPYWAVWPYETMIVPKKHYQHVGQLNWEEQKAFASILKDLTTKYDNLFETSFPYSSGIHQSPTDTKHPEWHFHMSFYPPLLRSAEVKKFMVGYEMFANPQRDITAEQAAKTLKSLSTTHYSKTN
ncbi:UDP-glucose--hexose-1-phosphate uridylyltransferase [Lutimonas saemankumensis]|uniref:UDP-glucose--hexose-1-phosphate uridylyltransferase n=1 Tax=Lutimonas saemankumensis TaxID=483016 RepID=UPI001CD578A0|nr:UDP-glucose--hexose-1-phosphate uridylyltransferase [Lutimonas saemankumensis]MCA0932459.1 UDP-glucose--hexose-1-phosphate uridylyltransferase [Lutimonas saemankumensis]